MSRLTINLPRQNFFHPLDPLIAPSVLDHTQGLEDVLIGYCFTVVFFRVLVGAAARQIAKELVMGAKLKMKREYSRSGYESRIANQAYNHWFQFARNRRGRERSGRLTEIVDEHGRRLDQRRDDIRRQLCRVSDLSRRPCEATAPVSSMNSFGDIASRLTCDLANLVTVVLGRSKSPNPAIARSC